MTRKLRTVQFVVRHDGNSKHGGDIGQLRKYGDLLADHDWASRYSYGLPETCERVDLIFLSNIDRPFELLQAVRYAETNSVPYVISTIHHSKAHLSQFADVRMGVLGLAERRLPGGVVDYLKHVMRLKSARAAMDGFKDVLDLNGALIRALENARTVLTLSAEEGQWLADDYRVALNNIMIIPNGMDRSAVDQPVGDVDWDVIVVGRIEHRKNQLGIAEVLQESPYRILFLGPANPQNKKYVRQFERQVDGSPNMQWIRGVQPEEVSAYMRRSEVSLSASFFEVQSLVDLEAAALGLQVIASTNGSTRSALGSSAEYVDPTELGGLPGLIDSLLAGRPHQETHWPSWQQVGSSLASTLNAVVH